MEFFISVQGFAKGVEIAVEPYWHQEVTSITGQRWMNTEVLKHLRKAFLKFNQYTKMEKNKS